ncbi:hypothetical protein ACROYT_G029758 [Oculina patagonica]
MSLRTRINGFTAWVNLRLSPSGHFMHNILTDLLKGYNMKVLLESLTGRPLEKLQSFDGLTQQQKTTRVEWIVKELKHAKVIPKDTYVDSRMFAMRCADQVFDLLWCLVCHDIWFVWERSEFLQQAEGQMLTSKPFSSCERSLETPDEILRDRLVLGIRDDRIRERLLRLNDLTPQQAVDQIKSSEQTQQQVKQMTGGDTLVHALNKSGNSDHTEDKKFPKMPMTRRPLPPRRECGNCGMSHGRECPAYGKTCFKCGRMNHFAHRCIVSSQRRRNRVSTVYESADPEQDPYYIGSIAENKIQARMAVIKLRISSPTPETEVQFQIDTGSQCDILPAWIYKQVTGDTQLQRLKPCQKEIVLYTGEHRKITGKVNLPVWSGRQQKSLDFNIIDSDYQPILSLNTSVGLGFRQMHEFVEDLEGVEVIADDFLIAGFGATDAEVNASLEKNERAFLQKCREWNLKLNKTKLKRAQTEVRLMGHLLTPEGLKADPSKVEAILDMPPPSDIKGLKRFLGMVNYLAKFLPLLSDMTEPLRRLDDKEVEWCWLEQHQKAFTTIKQYLADAPVLKYYDVNEEEVTIQCDASETGLGAVLMQKGQPIAFASRALTDTET